MLLIPRLIILKTLFPSLAFLLAWDMTWKWIALYKSWRKWEIIRFICIFIFNTCGILPIIYLLIDSLKNDNIEVKKENHKISTETKQTKKALKGGVRKWENVMSEKRQRETPKDSSKTSNARKTKKLPKK